jgi:hypothetical protein
MQKGRRTAYRQKMGHARFLFALMMAFLIYIMAIEVSQCQMRIRFNSARVVQILRRSQIICSTNERIVSSHNKKLSNGDERLFQDSHKYLGDQDGFQARRRLV